MRPLSSVVRAAGFGLALGSAACSGRTLVLGYAMAQTYRFGPAQVVAELATTARTDNPTLTGDLLEIFFTSDRGSGNGDIWTAKRAAADRPFDPPAAVAELNTSGFETSAAISYDGLTLWFGSDRSGGVGATDIWVSTRPSRSSPWSMPVDVVALNTPADDIPRPPGQHQQVMPLASTKAVTGFYQTYFATRASRGGPFGAPVAVEGIDQPYRTTVDGFLSDDGLTLFFASTPAPPTDAGSGGDASSAADASVGDKSDLFVAFRRSTGEKFEVTQYLTDLNTPADERDPWLTPDGKTLYFTSDRDGVLNIYTAQVAPR
jgi:hypothetical protein